MSDTMWNEIRIAKEENRHEIILSGPAISEKISKTGLDPSLFALTSLNFLCISDTNLESISDDISNLSNLSSLVLHSNNLKALTSSVCKLSKLKNVDVSRNALETFPNEFNLLINLYSLNASFNKLTVMESLRSNTRLTILDLSNNALEVFPDICHAELVNLAEVWLGNNVIKDIPHNINALPGLKLLDVSSNNVKEVPGELADISKLKELNLKGNPLADKRLERRVNQCHYKQVLDYVRQHGKRDASSAAASAKNSKKGNRKTSTSDKDITGNNQDEHGVDKVCHLLKVLHVTEATPEVQVDKDVKNIRPHIVCCIVKGLSFTPDSFKKFIKMQTQLHDTICSKRQVATLATHNMAAISQGPLKYVARPPDQVEMQPLGSTKATLASVLFSRLQKHARSVMMDHKRNKYSGIHKYLYLLEGKPLYPFVIDSSDAVISFPPLTNSNITKMSEDTKAMLVEVTSSTSQAICRKVLDTFLMECLRLGISEKNDDMTSGCTIVSKENSTSLTVEQVRVVDSSGSLQVVYPSRADLVFEDCSDVRVERNYE